MPAEPGTRNFDIGYILFIDVVGYSKLRGEEQTKVLRQLTDIVRGTQEFRRAEMAGQLVRLPAGDGMALVFFASPEAPVQCALEMSRALKQYPYLKVRMGVNSGPVDRVSDVNDRENVSGAGINMAERVMSCGDANHILLAKHIADDLAQYGKWRPHLDDLGEVEVKHGIKIDIVNLCSEGLGNSELPFKIKQSRRQKRLVRQQRLIWAGALLLITPLIAWGIYRDVRQREGSVATVPEKSIAVLPFENLSRDPDNAYFADGIQDEILTRLSKIADLKVISRTSTQHYKSAPEHLPEIGRQLDVAHVLEGSVQKSGDVVRVNVQLIKAANNSHLWAETFDRKLTDIFSVESEVAKAIADELRLHLTGREEQIITDRPTDNPEAYDAYLRGTAYALRAGNTPANALGAQKYLREAVKLDPKMALGWARLATVDALGYINHNLQPTVALCEEARQAAETALALQPTLGEALMARGHYYYSCLKDYDTAVQCFEQARQFLPNDSLIPQSLAYIARRRGQWDRSDSFFKQAERLDPRNVSLLTQHAFSYICLRRFPEALRKLDQILDITPDDIDTLAEKASIAQAEGDLPRAANLLSSLHPAIGDTALLEAQIYQAILERRPEQMISRLEKALVEADPALGYYKGELRFWLGWAQEVGGHHDIAQQIWREARSELEAFLKEQPENWALIGDLALTNMALGDKAAALSLSQRAMTGNPVDRDAVVGPASIEILARVAAQTGDIDRSVTAIQILLSRPYEAPLALNVPLTPALLRLDPMFDPLRNDPRFRKLASAPDASRK